MAVNGKNILIALGSTPIAGTKSNEMSTACDAIETSSPTNGEWRTYIAGRKDWDFTTGWLLATSSDVAKLLNVGQSYTVYIQDDNSTKLLQGSALCTKADVRATVGNLIAGSFAFKGNGPLETPPSS